MNLSFRFAAVMLGALTAPLCGAGQVIKVDDHSFAKAIVRTYHVTCTSHRFATIRLNPAEAQICGTVQDRSKAPICIVRPRGDPRAAIQDLAAQLCY